MKKWRKNFRERMGRGSYHKDIFDVMFSTLLYTLGTDLGSLAEIFRHVVGR